MPQTKRTNHVREVGSIVSFYAGIGKIVGLPHVFLNELLVDERGEPAAIVIGFSEESVDSRRTQVFKPEAIVVEFSQETVDAIFFNDQVDINKPVYRSGKLFSVQVSDDHLGRVVNGFGLPADGLGPITGTDAQVFRQAPQIIDRKPVATPLSAGVSTVDTMLSIGRGQRELLIGDRKLGKSTLAVDMILNQKNAKPPVYCVYVLCGQQTARIRDIVATFKERHAMAYTVVVAAPPDSSFAEQYLAPFVGCAIGEHFRDQGKDALVVYDDLTKHAKIYRDISLLLNRAPGREAYPGEIFSLHAGLLERAAQVSDEQGGGSLTALPIIETEEGDISSYIPTNVISITDGQIYFDSDLFEKGFLPAINIGLSVSRLGSQVQPPLLKKMTGALRLTLSQYKELQKLAQLETSMNDETTKKLRRGELILELLNQDKHELISWQSQVVVFFAAQNGVFDDLAKEQWKSVRDLLIDVLNSRYPDILTSISKGTWHDGVEKQVRALVEEVKKDFLSS
ncbi:MAG: F0F1 ATP synthase subunit alpha [Patescibacteria group bacterium]|nr:F0F1 ATP synthase subunit alpha [Patescibacteria group bacterium]